MIYVKKDNNQQVMDIQFDAKEHYIKVSIFDPAVRKFIEMNKNSEFIKQIILKLDLDMVRIIEDVIETLIQKEILLFTDFPEEVQNKLNFKKMLREQLSEENSFFEDEKLKL